MESPSGQVPCTYHPNVMTGLRCGRCGKPICSQDAVRTQVGLRCPECSGTRRPASIRTQSDQLVKAVGAAALVAIVVAVLWRFAPDWGFYLSLALGFGVVETIARLTGNKRGQDLQLIAIAIVTGGILLSRFLLAQRFGISFGDLNTLDAVVWSEEVRQTYGGPRSVANLLRIQAVPDLVYLALAYAIAWIRFR